MSLIIQTDPNAVEMETGLETTISVILAISLCLTAPVYTMIFLAITATYLRAFTQTRIIALLSVFGVINSFFNIPTAAIFYTTWNEFYRIMDNTGSSWGWCPVNAVSTHVLLSLEAWSFLFFIYYHWARQKNELIKGQIWLFWTLATCVGTALIALAPFIAETEYNYFPFRLWCTLIPSDDVSKLATALLLAIGHALPLTVLLCLNVMTLMALSPNELQLQKPKPIEPASPSIRSILFIALLQELLLLPTVAVEIMTLFSKTDNPPLSFARVCAWLRVVRLILIPWLLYVPNKQFREQSAYLLGFRKNRNYTESPRSRRVGKSPSPMDNKVPVLFVTSDGLYLQVKKDGIQPITTLSDSQMKILAPQPEGEKLILEDETQINVPNNKRPTKTVRFSQNVSEILPKPDLTFSFISHNY